jgi:hypothetical protein
VSPAGGAALIDMCALDTNGTGVVLGKEADFVNAVSASCDV